MVPAYNESENVAPLVGALVPILAKHGPYEIVFVDDGSSDGTLDAIKSLRASNAYVRYVALSRNFGHQAALRAGLAHARGECVVSMDADMQHPPELVETMIERWQQGFDVVYTVREEGRSLPFLKRLTSAGFYRLANALAGVRIEPGAADFRLLARPVVDVINDLGEDPLFLRGMLSWLGFKQSSIVYAPGSRLHGESKYTVRKMLSLATDGITSFSIRPLTMSAGVGALVSAGAFIYSLYVVYMRIFTSRAIVGWASVLAAVLWLGGIQLLVLGIIGEYLGKLFMQAKRRPFYVVRETSRDEERGP